MFVLFIFLENPNTSLRFFFSEVLNKYVGESEANIRSAERRVINCFTGLLKKGFKAFVRRWDNYALSWRKLLALNNLLFMYFMLLIINIFIFLFTMPEFLLVFIFHCSSLAIIVNTRTSWWVVHAKIWPFFTILHFRKLFAEAEEEQRKVCLLRGNVYCNFKTLSLKVGEQFLMLDDIRWPRNNQWENVLLGKKYFS